MQNKQKPTKKTKISELKTTKSNSFLLTKTSKKVKIACSAFFMLQEFSLKKIR